MFADTNILYIIIVILIMMLAAMLVINADQARKLAAAYPSETSKQFTQLFDMLTPIVRAAVPMIEENVRASATKTDDRILEGMKMFIQMQNTIAQANTPPSPTTPAPTTATAPVGTTPASVVPASTTIAAPVVPADVIPAPSAIFYRQADGGFANFPDLSTNDTRPHYRHADGTYQPIGEAKG